VEAEALTAQGRSTGCANRSADTRDPFVSQLTALAAALGFVCPEDEGSGGLGATWGPEGEFRGQRTHRPNLPARRTATRDPLTYTGAHSP